MACFAKNSRLLVGAFFVEVVLLLVACHSKSTINQNTSHPIIRNNLKNRKNSDDLAERLKGCKDEICFTSAKKDMEKGKVVEAILKALYWYQVSSTLKQWNNVDRAECFLNRHLIIESSKLKKGGGKRIVKILEKSCRHGNRISCFSIGKAYYYLKKFYLARKKLQVACHADNLQSCVDLGLHYFRNIGIVLMINKKNRLKIAHRWFDKACKGGNMIGCYYMYMLYIYNFEGASREKILSLAKKSCNEGYIKGCNKLNDMILLKRACDSALCTGCKLFSFAFKYGFNMAIDKKRGEALEIKACKLGSMESCLMMACKKAEGKSIDNDNLREMVERLCDFGRDNACFLLFNHYHRKDNNTYNRKKARYYRDRSRKHDPVTGTKITKVKDR